MNDKRMKNGITSLIDLLIKRFGENSTLVGCEIGVWKGGTSIILLKTFPNLHLYMIDPWQSDWMVGSMRCNKSQKILDEIPSLVCSDTKFAEERRTIIRNTGTEAVVDFEDDSLDFVFIDANHVYEYIKQDLNDWWTKVKPGGIFSGHDYNGRLDKKGIWGVKKAVDEFGKLHKLDVRLGSMQLWSIQK